jgi:hypothetical protein
MPVDAHHEIKAIKKAGAFIHGCTSDYSTHHPSSDWGKIQATGLNSTCDCRPFGHGLGGISLEYSSQLSIQGLKGKFSPSPQQSRGLPALWDIFIDGIRLEKNGQKQWVKT